MAAKQPTSKKRKKPPISALFHRDFKPPTPKDRVEALGEFPSSEPRPSSALFEKVEDGDFALDDLDDPLLYQPTGQVSKPTPTPAYSLDWLAQVPEEGQSLKDYVRFLTSRSGRLRPIANHKGQTIVLLPIVKGEVDLNGWSSNSHPLQTLLDPLVELTRAFFNRPVQLLSPASVTFSTRRTSMKEPGAFAKAAAKLSIKFPDGAAPRRTLVGRYDATTKRSQLQVESLLNHLSVFRSKGDGDNFCIMGVTLEDLYDGPKDLFCAGMAFGGSKVAAFSFARYHPHLRMSPQHWYDYGYSSRAGSYSYYPDGGADEPTKNLAPLPPGKLSKKSHSEFLLRCGKLLVHELGHLYGLDHCIYHSCLMMGTGHLVEDFAAPTALCSICLRKLQWRLGFPVSLRYERLANVWKTSFGSKQEAAWNARQARDIKETDC